MTPAWRWMRDIVSFAETNQVEVTAITRTKTQNVAKRLLRKMSYYWSFPCLREQEHP